MKPISLHIAILFVFLLGSVDVLRGQGFDWQYSSRLPTNYPSFFLGATGSGMWSRHTASMKYEAILPNGKLCDCGAVFRSAEGLDWSVGITAEYWLPNLNMALYGMLQVEQHSATFTSPGRELPLNPNVYTISSIATTYTLQTQTLNISIDAGLKIKLAPIPIFAAVGVQGSSVLVRQLNLQEEATISTFRYFASNLPTDFITFQPFVLSGRAALGVDIPLTRSVYASPAVFATIPFSSIIRGNEWSRLSFGVQVSLLYGFLP